MDRYHLLVLRALLWLILERMQAAGPPYDLLNELEAEIETAKKAGFDYYGERNRG